MSSAVLPHYPGFKIEIDRMPMWDTRTARSRSGFQRRVSEQVYPLWQITLSIEVLRDFDAAGALISEGPNLCGFFNLRAGSFDSFLYTDPDDNAVVDQQFGTRDGTTTQFQLLRSIGVGSTAFPEPVQNVNALTNIKSNGVALANPADYTISATGLVTLAVPGTAGHALTWTGSYYWRVHFMDDGLPFRRIFKSLWELKKLALEGSVMNKV